MTDLDDNQWSDNDEDLGDLGWRVQRIKNIVIVVIVFLMGFVLGCTFHWLSKG